MGRRSGKRRDRRGFSVLVAGRRWAVVLDKDLRTPKQLRGEVLGIAALLLDVFAFVAGAGGVNADQTERDWGCYRCLQPPYLRRPTFDNRISVHAAGHYVLGVIESVGRPASGGARATATTRRAKKCVEVRQAFPPSICNRGLLFVIDRQVRARLANLLLDSFVTEGSIRSWSGPLRSGAGIFRQESFHSSSAPRPQPVGRRGSAASFANSGRAGSFGARWPHMRAA